MGGVSGSSTADAAAIAKTMVPAMERRGYPKPFGVALTSAASILANMIPPSLGLIIYGALATVSVGALFVATIVPGLLMALALSIVVHFECIRRGIGERGARASWGDARRGAASPRCRRWCCRSLIVGGIRYGVFSATEAGAVAALYSVLCGVLIYRTANGASLLQALRESRRRDRDRDGGHRRVGAVRLRADHRAGAAEARRRAWRRSPEAGFCCCWSSTSSCCSSASRWR